MPEVEPEYFLKPQPPAVIEGTATIVKDEILPPVPTEPEQPSVPFALRGIDLDKIESRSELMAELNQHLPENEFTLPRYFYRADTIDYSLLRQPSADASQRYAVLQEMLDVSTVHLDYFLGYPTIAGQPFWGQFAYEPKEAYGAFLLFLEQSGARTFHHMQSYPAEMLHEWFNCYCWAYRARAYDLFKAAHHARQREQRILATENTHYLAAEKILGRVTSALESIPDEKLAEVEPDKLVAMLERLSKVQRVALGLPANGGQDPEKVKQNLSVELEMRQIAQNAGSLSKTDENADMGTILGDLEAIDAAQTLILRINK